MYDWLPGQIPRIGMEGFHESLNLIKGIIIIKLKYSASKTFTFIFHFLNHDGTLSSRLSIL